MNSHKLVARTLISSPLAAGLAVAFGALVACGASQPPHELLDARAAYDRARTGDAARLDPAAVHDAKTSLDTAERANADDSNSQKTRDLSYVAERKAELAEVNAGIIAASQHKEMADRQREANQAKSLRTTEGALKQESEELADSKQRLASTQGQLQQEHAAREAAEKRAKEAMDKLAVAAAVNITEEPRGTVITLPGNVLFTTGQATLLPDAQNRLGQVADALKTETDHQITVEGHTDSQGSEASNLDLSQRRAQTVRDFLVSRGIPTENISATGIGMSRPIADNKTVEGRAQNRRVEIVVKRIEKR
jgi:outer membrane protein OmpA-like peptidoglycan-associated protein